jgi:hypothetical protein
MRTIAVCSKKRRKQKVHNGAIFIMFKITESGTYHTVHQMSLSQRTPVSVKPRNEKSLKFMKSCTIKLGLLRTPHEKTVYKPCTKHVQTQQKLPI